MFFLKQMLFSDFQALDKCYFTQSMNKIKTTLIQLVTCAIGSMGNKV